MWAESVHNILVPVGLDGQSSLLLSRVWGFRLGWLQQCPGGSPRAHLQGQEGPPAPSRTVSDTEGFALAQGSTKA